VEEISAGDKFNPIAMLGLVSVIGLFALWAWSARDLIGGFWSYLGIFNRTGAEIGSPVSVTTENDNTQRSFLIGNKENETIILGTSTYIPENTNDIMGTASSEVTIWPTYTPYPTFTPEPTQTPWVITATPESTPTTTIVNQPLDLVRARSYLIGEYYSDQLPYDTISGRYSYYWPPLGGINCNRVGDIYDCDHMATGLKSADYVGIAWACVPEIPAHTVIYVHELDLWGRCLDRGGAIIIQDNLAWFDHLYDLPLINWGGLITVDLYQLKP
jgi:hypothetical protein